MVRFQKPAEDIHPDMTLQQVIHYAHNRLHGQDLSNVTNGLGSLIRKNYKNVADILTHSEDELLEAHGIGRKRLKAIQDIIAGRNPEDTTPAISENPQIPSI